MQDPDYIVDIDALGAPTERCPDGPSSGRRWLGVLFRCCDVYHRVYRNAAGTAYVGHCPRCCRPLNIRIGPGGSSARFFAAE